MIVIAMAYPSGGHIKLRRNFRNTRIGALELHTDGEALLQVGHDIIAGLKSAHKRSIQCFIWGLTLHIRKNDPKQYPFFVISTIMKIFAHQFRRENGEVGSLT